MSDNTTIALVSGGIGLAILALTISSLREAAAMKRWPEPVARPAEVATNGGCVEAGINAREQDNEVLGHKIRHTFGVCGQELGFGRFPGCRQCPIHKTASEGIFWQSEGCV